MRMGAGAVRWSRLVLVTLLAILVPLAAGVVPDDVWVAGPSEQLEDHDGPGRPAWSTAVAFTADLPTPPRSRLARRPVGDDPVEASRTGLTPTDRAPPRV